MFQSIEIRRVANGFVVTVNATDGEYSEYVFDNSRKALKFVKDYIEANPAVE